MAYQSRSAPKRRRTVINKRNIAGLQLYSLLRGISDAAKGTVTPGSDNVAIDSISMIHQRVQAGGSVSQSSTGIIPYWYKKGIDAYAAMKEAYLKNIVDESGLPFIDGNVLVSDWLTGGETSVGDVARLGVHAAADEVVPENSSAMQYIDKAATIIGGLTTLATGVMSVVNPLD